MDVWKDICHNKFKSLTRLCWDIVYIKHVKLQKE